MKQDKANLRPTSTLTEAQPSLTPSNMVPASHPSKPRPTQPTVLTREELYSAVWATPMSRLVEDYGISGNGLAKICDRENVP